MVVYFPRLKKISVIISLNNLYSPFSLSYLSESPIINILVLLWCPICSLSYVHLFLLLFWLHEFHSSIFEFTNLFFLICCQLPLLYLYCIHLVYFSAIGFCLIFSLFMHHLLTLVSIVMKIILKSSSGKLFISIPVRSVPRGLPCPVV